MEKLKMHSLDIVDENVAKIAGLFPDCVTESVAEDGSIRKAIDFDRLRQELSPSIVEGPKERYQINWPGRQNAQIAANVPIAKTLRPCREESVDFDATENLFIEGDNLNALKLLQETYLGKIKMIYIDPPYNTGKDFIYKDKFTVESGEWKTANGDYADNGDRLVQNTEANGRFHSDWLSMIYPRLKLARNLLSNDGVIFISIDDNEASNLKLLCDEIFGSQNFVENFVNRSNPRGNQAKKHTASEHEYVLCYARQRSSISPLGFIKDESEFRGRDKHGRYAETGLRKRGAGSRRSDAPNQYFPIYVNPDTQEITTTPTDGYHEVLPKLSNGTDGRWRWSKKNVNSNSHLLLARKVKRNGGLEFDVFVKSYFTGEQVKKVKSIFTEKEVNNENATEEIKNLFDSASYFDYPKPVYTVKKLAQLLVEDDDIVLDFFAGSSTAAHAVMKLNAEDGGKRKFIMVQIPEACDEKSEAFKAGYKTIADIGKERIRRAGAKIKEGGSLNSPDLDIGFRVLKIDSTSMKDVFYAADALKQEQLESMADNIKDDRTAEDLLFHIMLAWGVELSSPIDRETIHGHEVFFVNDDALVACFVKNGELGVDLCQKLAERKPRRAVFRNAGFKDDNAMINIEQIFNAVSPHTKLRVI